MAVCGACGTENRDKARFCRGCARSLTAAPATLATDPRPQTPASSPARTAGAPAGGRPARWMMAGLTLAVAGLAVWALGTQDRTAAPAASPLAAVPVHDAQATAAPPRPTTTSPDAGSATAAGKALTPNKNPPLAAATERPAAERRAQAERDRVARERRRLAQVPEPPRPEPGKRQAEPAALPVAAAPVAVQAPPPATTVDQACAGSSNFLTRDICRMRACGTPAMAGDPVCVRFREREEASRNRLNQ